MDEAARARSESPRRQAPLWFFGVISPSVGIAVAYLVDSGIRMGVATDSGDATVRWASIVFSTPLHAALGLSLPACAAAAVVLRSRPGSTVVTGMALGLSVAWSASTLQFWTMAALVLPFKLASGEFDAFILLWGAWGAVLCCAAMHVLAARRMDGDRRDRIRLFAGCLTGMVALIGVDAMSAGSAGTAFGVLTAALLFVWGVVIGICVAARNADGENHGASSSRVGDSRGSRTGGRAVDD